MTSLKYIGWVGELAIDSERYLNWVAVEYCV